MYKRQRRALITHPVYTQVDNLASLHTFMSFHVWAVWDFMCLLKSLQTQLSCVQVPWFPQGDRALRRLVNEIVVSEESDEDGHGGFAAHFELYLEAMQQCGADARAIQRFITALREGKETTAALALAAPPAGAQAFSLHTSQTVTTGSLPTLAAAFTFGREDVVPSMFQAVLDEIQESHLSTYDRFIYYLDRHIAVDADEHGPMAFEMVDRDQRRVARHCQRLGTDQADHHPADKPGAGSRGDRVALVQADTRILQHALDHRGEPFGMRARCNLGHHTAEGGVRGSLRGDPLRHDPASAVDQRDRGFVAGAFYAENQCHPAFP